MSFALRQEQLPHYTIAEWKHWPGQWEIIGGIPYAMTPMASPRHQAINGRSSLN